MPSDKYLLAKFDVSGIQSYIFATNRLRENVGASSQVTKILEEYLPQSIGEAVKEAGYKETQAVILWKEQDKLEIAENTEIQAEIIYIGGGNAMVLFRKEELFMAVGRKLGEKTARNCQGLSVAAAAVKLEWDKENFGEAMRKLDAEMAVRKARMIRQPVYSPFPVVEQDNVTHQPITRPSPYADSENGDETVSVKDMTEIQFQKLTEYGRMIQERRGNFYPDLGEIGEYQYPVEMNDLCPERGDNSYIAVVHIDGNGMGERLLQLKREQPRKAEGEAKRKQYSEEVCRLRNVSKEISSLFSNTYKEVLKRLIPLAKEEKTLKFSIRPIVLDGDDFTFLCPAKQAVPIAAAFLQKLDELQKENQGEDNKITACAGIAFVYSHFPFYVAYDIAEEACANAKKSWYQASGSGCKNSYLDFYVVRESEVGGVKHNTKWQKGPYQVLETEKKEGVCLSDLKKTMEQMEKEWPSNRLHRIYQTLQETEEKQDLETLKKEFHSRKHELEDLEECLFDALELRGLCDWNLLESSGEKKHEKMEA